MRVVGVIGEQPIEQVGGREDIPPRLLEKIEVDPVARSEHLGEPRHSAMVMTAARHGAAALRIGAAARSCLV